MQHTAIAVDAKASWPNNVIRSTTPAEYERLIQGEADRLFLSVKRPGVGK